MAIFSALYDKVLMLAGKRNAKHYLAAVSFAEALFFPIPPDVMLAPMVLANPERAFSYARIAICFSIFGGILGYCFAYLAFQPIVEPMLQMFGYQELYYKILKLFNIWGFWLFCAMGVVPIPYKLFTISAGVLQYNIGLFIVASLIARSIRFFLVSMLIKSGGQKMQLILRNSIDKLIWLIISITIIAIIIKKIWFS